MGREVRKLNAPFGFSSRQDGEKKGKKKMKKIVLTVMAMLSMTLTYAEGEKVNVEENLKIYDMTVNQKRLAMCLGLDFEQMDAVEMIHDQFCKDMRKAAVAPEEEQQALLDKAVTRDLRYMHWVLDRRQYRKYQQLLNVTLVNRGLKKE